MIVATNVPYSMVRDNVRRIAAAEIGVEIYFDNDAIEQIDTGDVKGVSGLLKDADIACTVHAPFMDLSPGGVDRAVRAVTKDKLKKSVEVANLLCARGIVCHGGYNKWFFDARQQVWLDAAIDTFGDVLKEADAGLSIMIENIFEEEPAPLVALLGHFSGKNLHFCFDSGHFNLFSRVSLEEWLVPFGDRIREMHLHDNHGSWDEHLPIGMGTFPFRDLKSFIGRLDGVIYTAENHSEELAMEGIKRLKEFLN